MAHIFDITPPKEVRLDGKGTTEVSFTVTNGTDNRVKGRAVLGPEKSPVLSWLTLVGEPEREFAPKQPQTFSVKVAVPAGTPPGSYPFRLDTVSVARPDEDSTEGPPVGITVSLAPTPPKKFPWWIVAAVVAGLAILGFVALKMIPDNKVAVVDLTGKNIVEASAYLTNAHLKLGPVDKVLRDAADVDKVLSQDPKPPVKVAPDTPIHLQVGVAIVSVPTLKGMTYDAALKALADQHLEVGNVANVNRPGVPTPGLVLDCDPPQGSKAQSHDAISMMVQQANVPVPIVIGQPLPVVQSLLMASNLRLGTVTGSVIIGFGQLSAAIGQSPNSGSVPIGTPVNVVFPGGTVPLNIMVKDAASHMSVQSMKVQGK